MTTISIARIHMSQSLESKDEASIQATAKESVSLVELDTGSVNPSSDDLYAITLLVTACGIPIEADEIIWNTTEVIKRISKDEDNCDIAKKNLMSLVKEYERVLCERLERGHRGDHRKIM